MMIVPNIFLTCKKFYHFFKNINLRYFHHKFSKKYAWHGIWKHKFFLLNNFTASVWNLSLTDEIIICVEIWKAMKFFCMSKPFRCIIFSLKKFDFVHVKMFSRSFWAILIDLKKPYWNELFVEKCISLAKKIIFA